MDTPSVTCCARSIATSAAVGACVQWECVGRSSANLDALQEAATQHGARCQRVVSGNEWVFMGILGARALVRRSQQQQHLEVKTFAWGPRAGPRRGSIHHMRALRHPTCALRGLAALGLCATPAALEPHTPNPGAAALLPRPLLPPDHPLDQLTPQEVSRASAVVRAHAAAQGVTGTLRFNSERHAAQHPAVTGAVCLALHGAGTTSHT